MPPYTRIKKLANIFRNLITYVQDELDLPDYHVQADLPLPEPDGRERTIGEILALLTGTGAPAT
jgi:hypothetical protein